MPHEVRFEECDDLRSLITEEQCRALIDLLFRGEDSRFTIRGVLPAGVRGAKATGLAGQCQKMLDGSTLIHLVPKNIRGRVGRGGAVGGNRRIPNPQLAAGLCLTHELQHANQFLMHKPNSSFYGRAFQKYAAWPHEREARQYADDNLHLVAGVLGIQIPPTGYVIDETAELVDLVDCFLELDEVPLKDLIFELRECNVLNPENVRKCREKLEEYGVKVLSGSSI